MKSLTIKYHFKLEQMNLKCRYAKTKGKYKLESATIYPKLFLFLQKWSVSELKIQILREIGSFDIFKCIQPIPRIENSFAIPGFSIWKVATQLFRWILRINSVNEAILIFQVTSIYKTTASKLERAFKHYRVFSTCSELISRAHNTA